MSEYGKVLNKDFETMYGEGSPLAQAYEEIYGEPIVFIGIDELTAEEKAVLTYFAELGGKTE